VTEAASGPSSDATVANASEEATLPEAVMLLLFNPRNGSISGEGLTLMYTLGGAMPAELAIRGHIELDDSQRRARAVGDGPADPLLRGAWERIPTVTRVIASLVIDIGTRSRESTLDALVARGEIRRVPHRFLGLFASHSLKGGDTDTRERLLGPVRAALIDGVAPDGRTAAIIALLSASKNLPAMHADIPWSGVIHTRGKEFERGDWGATAASDVIVTTLVVQVVSLRDPGDDRAHGLTGAVGRSSLEPLGLRARLDCVPRTWCALTLRAIRSRERHNGSRGKIRDAAHRCGGVLRRSGLRHAHDLTGRTADRVSGARVGAAERVGARRGRGPFPGRAGHP
jgi:hypothetical protein